MNTNLSNARVKGLIGYTISLFFLLSSAHANVLRIATYNIKHGEGMDGKVDLDRQIEVLKKMNPDLVALQEVDRNVGRSGNVDQAKYIAEKMGMHMFFGKAIPLGKGEYGQALLSKYPMDRGTVYKLPSIGEQRIVVAAEIEVPNLGRALFCSVHYSYESEEERFPQVETFEKASTKYTIPIILTGDFNAQPETKTMQHYGKHWYVIPKKGDRLTSPARNPTSEIDFCVLKNWRNAKASTVVIDEPMASDHRPLLTLIQW